MPRGLTQKQAQKFKPYATALAGVIYSWNRLQVSLSLALTWLVGFESGEATLAMWNAIPSDSNQRAMLTAVLNIAKDEKWKNRPKAKEDIEWIVEKAGKLSSRRNAAVHSPYQMENTEPFRLLAAHVFGNKLAIRLKDKDLLAEFKLYSTIADDLYFFCLAILHALMFSETAWPDRPQLPPFDKSQIPKHKIPKNNPKRPRHPPGSLPH
jgi:hypothetical protein